MKDTYHKLFGISVKFSLLIVGFTLLAVMFLYGEAEADVAAIEEYMEGAVPLNFLVVGTAKGTLFFMKAFFVLAAIVAMLLHLFLHLMARLLQNGEEAGWKNLAGFGFLILAFVIELLLIAVSYLTSFGNLRIPGIMALVIFADACYEFRTWKNGMVSVSSQQ